MCYELRVQGCELSVKGCESEFFSRLSMLNLQVATFPYQPALAGFVFVATDFSRWVNFVGSVSCPTDNEFCGQGYGA
ncbi:MAG: hypothetical protein DFNUSKGM_000491 [Candidatus Fervidibacter sacchari]